MIKSQLLLLIFLGTLVGCLNKDPELEDVGSSAPKDITFVMLSIIPSGKIMSPGETFKFEGSGGSGQYSFSIQGGNGSITKSGYFTASFSTGATTIKVEDSNGNTAYAAITVGTTLTIGQDANFIKVGSTASFSANNGLPDYEYYIISGEGSINALTGDFTASANAGTVQIGVRDANGKLATTSIEVVEDITVSSSKSIVKFTETANITASGGVPPYNYTIVGGTSIVGLATGLFTAGSTAENAIVRVTDTVGLVKDISLQVVSGPSIIANSKLAINRTMSLSVLNGVGTLNFTIVSGPGSINATTGDFTAPADVGTTVVRVTDANGHTDDHTIETFVPRKLSLRANVTCILDFADLATSTLKCFGASPDANLGIYGHYIGDEVGEMGDNLEPINLGTDEQPLAIFGADGSLFKCVLFDSNRLRCWGYNPHGQLASAHGSNRGEYINTMGGGLEWAKLGVEITSNPAIPPDKRVAAGYYHICAITDGDNVKCWGHNDHGEAGEGEVNQNIGNSAATVNAGMLYANIGSTVRRIAAGHRTTCAILSDGNVKCWGYNLRGQLGTGNTVATVDNGPGLTVPSALPNVDLNGSLAKEISMGHEHVCIITTLDEVKCWGRNEFGQLGLGTAQNMGDHPGEMGAALPTTDLGLAVGETVVKLVSGYYHNCVLLSTGKVKCWGYGIHGEVGNEISTYIGDQAGEMGASLPYVSLGTGLTAVDLFARMHQTCAILDNNETKCWGFGSTGGLGLEENPHRGNTGGSMGDNLPTVSLGTGETAVGIAPGHTTCVLLASNNVKCFGQYSYGVRGDEYLSYGAKPSQTVDQLPAVNLGTGVMAKDVNAGVYSTCVITMDDKVKCWGQGVYGQLGVGNSALYGWASYVMGDNLPFANYSSTETVTSIDGGAHINCALMSNGRVRCYGQGLYGVIGQETAADGGGAPAILGDNLPYINLGTLAGNPIRAKQIALGYRHACALLENDRVKCWGGNDQGQLGYEDFVHRGLNAGDMGDNLPYVDLGTVQTAKSIIASHLQTCVIRTDDKLFCWGYGPHGQLGTGTPIANWGGNAGQMGTGLIEVQLGTGLIPVKVVMALGTACALLDNGLVKCWGSNSSGDIAIGHTSTVGTSPAHFGDNLEYALIDSTRKIIDIDAGWNHYCAVLDDNSVKCWGYNYYGQLGLGHSYHVGTDAFSIGSYMPELSL